jgi:hypothetical protein
VFNITSISAPRPPVDWYSTAQGVERPPEEALLPADRVSLSSEARQQLRRAGGAEERGEGRGGEAAEAKGGEAKGAEGKAGEPSTGGAKGGAGAAGKQAGGKLSAEQQAQVTELQQRDSHVRSHESAHQAAGGDLTGPASYSYQTGPDGRSYAVGGEVPIQSRSGRTPDETIAIARRVRAAALAPSDPSPADLAAASAASQVELAASQQKRQQGAQAAKGGGAGPQQPGSPPITTPRANLERLIVRAPEEQPFL